MDWREHITFGDVCSFAWGAVKLYETLADLEARGFGTLVVPSRGTFPFTDRLFTIHQKWSKTREHENRVLHGRSTPFHRSQITLPFTADSTLDDPGTGQGISYQIRDYWVKVLRAWIDGDLNSPELSRLIYLSQRMLCDSEGRRNLSYSRLVGSDPWAGAAWPMDLGYQRLPTSCPPSTASTAPDI
ncbi:hypothetical protein AN403_6123 [Pseudomonas fluorescens]|uniref:Uncharacterized protein n=1 Tax=Pseudomonas fluorescens TaxID=294 RepID=A0A0P8X6Y1_PSEFL|nr:hypothetical protein AN403_6123 [Pseudomonas fluorescens]